MGLLNGIQIAIISYYTMPSSLLPQSFIDPLITIAQRAGAAILALYQNKDITLRIKTKADATPLTEADLQSHDILLHALQQMTPAIPIVSEEGDPVPWSVRSQWPSYWLIDPLDGTKEFIAHTDEFCICIALVEQQQPILGMIYIPITDTSYYAVHQMGAFVRRGATPAQAIHTRKILPTSQSPVRAVVSRRHMSAKLRTLLATLPKGEILPQGSAIKFARIAEGSADFYPSTGKTQAWDTAAGQCILQEAGGRILTKPDEVLHFAHHSSMQNPAFLAVGDPQHPWQDLLAGLA